MISIENHLSAFYFGINVPESLYCELVNWES